MSDDVVVALDGASKSYGSTPALHSITVSVVRGEMFGVIGPDGAGKTTLLRVICGLLAPDRGTVRLFGRDPVRARRAAAAAIGYVSQRFSLYGDLSIDENIEFFARLHGVHDFRERRDRLLTLTGLVRFRDRLADRLSGGMKQKLALACTLVHEPPLLVLDEPTTGVDPVSRREFWKLLAEFLDEGLSIVVATPYLDEAERCSRVLLIREGRPLALDTPAHLQASLRGTVVEVVAPAPRQALDALRDVLGPADVQLFGDRLHVYLRTSDARGRLTDALRRSGLDSVPLRDIAPSLEDVFIEAVDRAQAPPVSPSPEASL